MPQPDSPTSTDKFFDDAFAALDRLYQKAVTYGIHFDVPAESALNDFHAVHVALSVGEASSRAEEERDRKTAEALDRAYQQALLDGAVDG